MGEKLAAVWAVCCTRESQGLTTSTILGSFSSCDPSPRDHAAFFADVLTGPKAAAGTATKTVTHPQTSPPSRNRYKQNGPTFFPH